MASTRFSECAGWRCFVSRRIHYRPLAPAGWRDKLNLANLQLADECLGTGEKFCGPGAITPGRMAPQGTRTFRKQSSLMRRAMAPLCRFRFLSCEIFN
jgi:hypothetical protein